MSLWVELLLFSVSSIILNITSYWTRVGWRKRGVLILLLDHKGLSSFKHWILRWWDRHKWMTPKAPADCESSFGWQNTRIWWRSLSAWVVYTLCLWEHLLALLNSISWRALGLFLATVTKTTQPLSSACSLCLRLDLFCYFSSCQPLHFSLFLVSVSLYMRCEGTSLKADLNDQ